VAAADLRNEPSTPTAAIAELPASRRPVTPYAPMGQQRPHDPMLHG